MWRSVPLLQGQCSKGLCKWGKAAKGGGFEHERVAPSALLQVYDQLPPPQPPKAPPHIR
jgi:hypothetical protein